VILPVATWWQARETCQNNGLDLAVIDTVEEHQELIAHLTKFYARYDKQYDVM